MSILCEIKPKRYWQVAGESDRVLLGLTCVSAPPPPSNNVHPPRKHHCNPDLNNHSWNYDHTILIRIHCLQRRGSHPQCEQPEGIPAEPGPGVRRPGPRSLSWRWALPSGVAQGQGKAHSGDGRKELLVRADAPTRDVLNALRACSHVTMPWAIMALMLQRGRLSSERLSDLLGCVAMGSTLAFHPDLRDS